MKTAFARLRARHFLSSLSFVFLLNSSDAQTNQAISLNGTGGHASLGTVSPAGNFSTGMTIECWVKWNGFNTWSRLVELGNGSGSDNLLFANENNTGNLRFEVYRGGSTQGLSTSSALITGRWYHVAVTQSSAGATSIYVDGVVAATGTVQTPNNVSRAQCYIGRSSWVGDGYLNGKVDEVRIWNVVRTASEIRQSMLKTVASNASGLVAYYRCNEGSGTTLTNSSTNAGAGNGTVAAGLTWTSSPALRTANAVNLDGTDDYVSIGSPLVANSSYTKEAWVYVTKSTSTPQNIVSSSNSPMWIDGGTLKAGNNGSIFQINDPGVLPANTWVHVAVTYNAATQNMALYRNGTQVATATVANAYVAQNNYIGAWYNGTGTESYLGGSIDEVRVWNVARTQSEIAATMYKEIDPAAEANLVAYYTFNQGTTSGDNTGMITVPDQKTTANASLVNMTLSGTSSNFLQQNATLVVLPVRFGEFVAQKQNSRVLLQWSAITEQALQPFRVEHSTNGDTWTVIGEVPVAGKDNTMNKYSFVHAAPANGLNYYRVAKSDAGGKTAFTAVRSVSIQEKEKSFSVLNTLVNNGVLQVQVKTDQTLSLYTQEGKLLWSKEMKAGLQSLPVGNNGKGMFYLSGEGTTERIMIQ